MVNSIDEFDDEYDEDDNYDDYDTEHKRLCVCVVQMRGA